MVSKQYAGPQIVSVDLGPPNALDYDTTTGITTIVPRATRHRRLHRAGGHPEQIQGAVEANRGYVLFTVTPLNGQAVASQKVSLPVSSTAPAHYHYSWDNFAAPNGVYIFEAVAVAGFGSRSQGMRGASPSPSRTTRRLRRRASLRFPATRASC